MDTDVYYKLRRGNIKTFRELQDNELRRLWFVCYQITQDAGKAASLLLTGWKQTVEEIVLSDSVPQKGFREIFSQKAFALTRGNLESSDEYEALTEPKVAKEYLVFVHAIKQLDHEERCMYLLTTFGGFSVRDLSSALNESFEQCKKRVSDISQKAQDSAGIRKLGMKNAVFLSTQFRCTDGKPFVNIDIPQALINALEHDYQLMMRASGKETTKSNVRKENRNMKSPAKPAQKGTAKKTGFKYTKPIVIASILLVAVIAAILFLPKLLSKNTVPTRITSYNVEEITYGNVSTTITGSGTLTPITSKTLTSAYGGEVESVKFTVGDEVAENDVIAVISGDHGDEEIIAPCDGILIEFPIAVGDEVAKGSSAAMVMGKDGFTMGIAVDELNISSVALEQEVAFTIDAVSGDHKGSVTAISYNGSTSGGSVAYQITATVEYIEGVYPGMSASAEIVIEDSGEGLLVPVDAVKTSGDDSYIYIAPSGSELGTQYEEGKIDLNDLTKVTVETGMSDGSYIMIESDELAEGDLIIVTKVTSTATGSDKDSTGGGMGGFPGGGMNFEDFDFGNFDPGQMPNGGGFPGAQQ